MDPRLLSIDNPEVLEVIEGLLDLCIEREKEIAELTFEVETLRRRLEELDRPKPELEHSEVAHQYGGRYDILVAEGVDTQRKQLVKLLVSAGYQVVAVAKNGYEALELYIEKMPALVTIDTHLPFIDGYQTTRQIKEFDPEAKVIILSRARDRQMVLEAIMAGASDYICKPFQPIRLLRSVDRLLAG